MVPRFWFVTDAEARQQSEAAPFKTAFANLPPDDRLALTRLVLEGRRRHKTTGVGSKRTLKKWIANARRNYQQWRDERPDEYQLWRDVLKGAAPLATPIGSGVNEHQQSGRIEFTTMDLTPRNCFGTLVVDANGAHQFLDISAEREYLRERIGNAYEVRQRLEAVEKRTQEKLIPPLRIGTIYIGSDWRGERGSVEWWESLTLED